MGFKFLAIAVPENGYADELSAALNKIKAAMSKGAKLTVSPRQDSNGYPYYWVEIIDSHKTEGIKLLASEEITAFLFHYMTLGKPIEVIATPEKVEEMKNEYTDRSFGFELFKYEVEQGKRIHRTSQSYSVRYKCFTTYTMGRVMHSLEMTEEIKAFLEERDLL